MFRPRPLLLLAVLLFYSAFGVSENVGKSEITEGFKKSFSRKDAEQDPFTTVTLDGDSHSTLFSTCLANARTIQARFASIEVVPGSEYIRYVPDSIQMSTPISWNVLNGNYADILDCAQAAHDGSWSMFKYNGSKCEVVNSIYNLDDVPKCEETDSEAVFILSTATNEECPRPRFVVGIDQTNEVVCGLVSNNLMTYDEAMIYCAGVYPNQELQLFYNNHQPLALQDFTAKLTEHGYTTTNLWVDTVTKYYGHFYDKHWWNGVTPGVGGAPSVLHASYIDKDAGFKLRQSDTSYKAGAYCVTRSTYVPEG